MQPAPTSAIAGHIISFLRFAIPSQRPRFPLSLVRRARHPSVCRVTQRARDGKAKIEVCAPILATPGKRTLRLWRWRRRRRGCRLRQRLAVRLWGWRDLVGDDGVGRRRGARCRRWGRRLVRTRELIDAVWVGGDEQPILF